MRAPDGLHTRRPTVGEVFFSLVRHPVDHLIRRWNWKSALTSSIIRSNIFFTTNLSAGLDAALGAMAAEFTFRALTSGFYGSVTESFRRAEPAWLSNLTVMMFLPLFSHSIEFLVHWLRGTPKIWTSIMVSICFTAISTLFNLYAMRRGALIVGEGRQSLWADLRSMPGIIGSFLASGPVALWRLAQGPTRVRK